LVKHKRIEGITALRDESDKSGMRMVIQLRRGEVAEVVLNNLYQHTQMQSVFGINLVALIDNQPKTFNLRQLLQEFIRHRREVVTRRTIFELRKARARAHVLEGLAVALANIDAVIDLIKASPSPAEAKSALMARSWQPGVVTRMLERSGADMSRPLDLADGLGLIEDGYRLSETQAQAILDLRLHRLTGLEQDKIIQEYGEILDQIAELLGILGSGDRLMQVIRDELIEIRDRYGDERRTEIVLAQEDLTNEDLITPEDMVVTLSHAGYAKSQPLADYRAQRRGGKGRIATRTRDEDFVERMFVANTHDTILCFSNHGKVYWLKVYQLQQAGRTARGRPLVNLLPLAAEEMITTVLPLSEYPQDHFVVMATASGVIKKCVLSAFTRPRSTGLIAVELLPGDSMIGAGLTDGGHDILLFGSDGKAVRFAESEVRAMGRTARGVRGISLAGQARVISMLTVAPQQPTGTVLTATRRGYGKRTRLPEFPRHRRGGHGVIAIRVKGRNGAVVGALLTEEDDEIMLITDGGTLIRTRVSEVSLLGRNTQGVRLINLHEEEDLVSVVKVDESRNGDNGIGNGNADSEPGAEAGDDVGSSTPSAADDEAD
jgi:DNA gyrase subunit A